MDTVEEPRWVEGFLFDDKGGRVALILKRRPDYLAGKWNGIGGKVEAGETAWAAMVREFHEEAGVETVESDWFWFASLATKNGLIRCYCTFSSEYMEKVRRMTDEWVRPVRVRDIYLTPDRVVPNTRWLIPMVLSVHADEATSFEIVER